MASFSCARINLLTTGAFTVNSIRYVTKVIYGVISENSIRPKWCLIKGLSINLYSMLLFSSSNVISSLIGLIGPNHIRRTEPKPSGLLESAESFIRTTCNGAKAVL